MNQRKLFLSHSMTRFQPGFLRQTFQPSSNANLEFLKKSLGKPGDQDLKPGDLKNMHQIKTTATDYLFQSILCLVQCSLLYSFAVFFFFAELRRFSLGLNLRHGEVSSGLCNFISSKFSRVPSSLRGERLSALFSQTMLSTASLPCITVWQNQLCHLLKMA